MIKRRFIISRLYTGIGLIAAEASICSFFYGVGIMPILVLVAGGLAIPIGVLVALKSWGKVCSRCNVPLLHCLLSGRISSAAL